MGYHQGEFQAMEISITLERIPYSAPSSCRIAWMALVIEMLQLGSL